MKVGITERGDAATHLQEWLTAAEKEKVLFTIAITKNPQVLLDNINLLPSNTIIHCTITGWGDTVVEPNVPTPTASINAYHQLVQLLGYNRVVLRIDPIIPTVRGVLAAEWVYFQRRSRVRVSILDFYRHVQNRFYNLADRSVFDELIIKYSNGIHLPLSERKVILNKFPEAEICGEPSIPSTGCVSLKDFAAVNLAPPLIPLKSKQRSACTCIGQKTELLKNKERCVHNCAYCYWKS